jgi:hypothetical protein
LNSNEFEIYKIVLKMKKFFYSPSYMGPKP